MLFSVIYLVAGCLLNHDRHLVHEKLVILSVTA